MIESDDDLLVFFDGFGEDDGVVFTVGGVALPAIPAIFDTRPPFTATNFKGFRATSDMGRALGSVAGSTPRLLCRTIDLATIKAGRATVAVRGLTYNVFDIEPDGTGLSTLEIKQA